MTREEALLYLPEQDGESLEDRFEQVLFEIKQSFSTKTPVSKLISNKLRRLERIEEAFRALGGVPENFDGQLHAVTLEGETVREVVDRYSREKGILKIQLLSQGSVEGIKLITDRLLLLTRVYAEKWSTVDVSEIPEVPIGNEPDPMEILRGIQEMESNGWNSFTEINLLEGNSPLKTEAKRLSLWLKFEDNDR